ncbi:SGNH/GDSL hydrolase family protein [Ammoniphilus sp. YIM 78166]|uniref:SGNH/GDSL hydrolase family protein n=1 Tax=Ammoniphilus sp. YIM 78166 TaxID=1644106 RepID=UPI00106F45C9|nr:SGNH/GDSL hydrolase family protein [Ammoniphilus sp. YIM 78166]
MKWIRINHRVLILLVTFLVGLDWIIGFSLQRQYAAGATYRLAVEERNTLISYTDFIREDQGRKVVFIGDSVMYGSSVRKGEETIPAYVSSLAREKWPDEEIHFYNVGIRGLGIADAYFLLKSLHNPQQPIDLLVYNLNTGWFNEPKIINREMVLELFPPNEVAWSSLQVEPPVPLDENSWIRKHLLSHWKLYAHRSSLSHWIFGQETSEWVQDQADYAYGIGADAEEDDSLYTPWFEKVWDEKMQGDWKLGSVSHETMAWRYFEYFLQLADQTSQETLIFFTPRNVELLDHYRKVDYQAMDDTKQELEHKVTQYGHHFLDYETRVDSSQFSDTVHLLSEGHEEIAEHLVEDMERLHVLFP